MFVAITRAFKEPGQASLCLTALGFFGPLIFFPQGTLHGWEVGWLSQKGSGLEAKSPGMPAWGPGLREVRDPGCLPAALGDPGLWTTLLISSSCSPVSCPEPERALDPHSPELWWDVTSLLRDTPQPGSPATTPANSRLVQSQRTPAHSPYRCSFWLKPHAHTWDFHHLKEKAHFFPPKPPYTHKKSIFISYAEKITLNPKFSGLSMK